MNLYISENSICDTRPFCRHCLVTPVLWCILHPSYSGEPVSILDHQILLKSSHLTSLAGSAPASGKKVWRTPALKHHSWLFIVN